MSDHWSLSPETPSSERVLIEGIEYDLIRYGDEKLDGVDIFSLDCHVCGASPGHRHRDGCALGAGRRYARPPTCRDCGVAIGLTHILGCGIEQCPRCRGQYVSCDCEGSEDSIADREDA